MGHRDKVVSLSLASNGHWLASSSKDGTVKLWEILTGRCKLTWDFPVPVRHVSWCPFASRCIVAACVVKKVHVFNIKVEDVNNVELVNLLLSTTTVASRTSISEMNCLWSPSTTVPSGLVILHGYKLKCLTWHPLKDYFASVIPNGYSDIVLVHHLRKKTSRRPFKTHKSKIFRILFHPRKPLLYVALHWRSVYITLRRNNYQVGVEN